MHCHVQSLVHFFKLLSRERTEQLPRFDRLRIIALQLDDCLPSYIFELFRLIEALLRFHVEALKVT